MRTILVAVAIVGCCVGAPQSKSINYDIPSGSVRYMNQYVSPSARYVQPALRPVQPYVQHVANYAQQPMFRQEALVKSVAAPTQILSMNSASTFDGNFNYDFASENGIQSTASGSVKPVPGSDDAAQVISGSYSYTSPDGTPVVTNWYADETGFHAEGDHLPVSPPIPDEIQRSLEYLRSLPPNPEDHKYD